MEMISEDLTGLGKLFEKVRFLKSAVLKSRF
jgi:hypothetical protein